MKHTQTPWRVTDGTTIKEDSRPISEDGVLIASACGYSNSGFFPSDEEGLANAEFIVRACNAHDELVAALQRFVAVYGDTFVPNKGEVGPYEQAMAAIANATGSDA